MAYLKIDLLQKRREPRFPCRFPVEVKAENRKFKGQALDFSPGGMRIKVEQPLTRGQILTIEGIPYEYNGSSSSLPAQVTWVNNKMNTTNSTELGVKFFVLPKFFSLRPYGIKTTPLERGLRKLVPVNLQPKQASKKKDIRGVLIQLGFDLAVVQGKGAVPPPGDYTIEIGPISNPKAPTLHLEGARSDLKLISPTDAAAPGDWEAEFSFDNTDCFDTTLLKLYLESLA